MHEYSMHKNNGTKEKNMKALKCGALLLGALLMCGVMLTGCGDEDEKTNETEENGSYVDESKADNVNEGKKHSEGLEFISNGDGTCYVSSIGSCTDIDIVIPQKSPDGDTVTSIGDEAFAYCEDLKSIIICEGVKSINPWAFGECANLISVVIPDTLTSIGEGAFTSCNSLAEINISPNVTFVGARAFEDCESLIAIDLPDNLTSIEDELFAGCPNLAEVNIPEKVISIGFRAFENCESLERVIIPNGVTSIERETFSGCTSLKSIVVGQGVASIEKNAFGGNVELASIIVDENNPIYHSSGNCLIETASKTLVMGCQNSAIPADGSVTHISQYAFNGCKGMRSIEIPSSVISISKGAFYECTALESITVNQENLVYHSAGNCLIETEKKTLLMGCQNSVIPNDGTVTNIGYEAFANCINLTNIVIPDSVTQIANRAFVGCSRLASIEIPDSVTNIGTAVFLSCNGLETITVDQKNSSYHSDGNCLIETESKTLIVGCKNSFIPQDGTVTSIGDYAFDSCNGLTSITIPGSVTSIGGGVFFKCDNLKDFIFLGTKAEWEAIKKENSWDDFTSSYTIYCTDGDIPKGKIEWESAEQQ